MPVVAMSVHGSGGGRTSRSLPPLPADDCLNVPRWIMPLHKDDAPHLTFGQVLERERLKRGWSQEYVGAAIGVRQGKISEYENDKKSDPPVMNVVALEDLFGFERGELGAMLWGERVRDEIRRLFARGTTYVLAPDSPSALHDLIDDVAVLEPEDIIELRDEARKLWHARRNGPSRSASPGKRSITR